MLFRSKVVIIQEFSVWYRYEARFILTYAEWFILTYAEWFILKRYYGKKTNTFQALLLFALDVLMGTYLSVHDLIRLQAQSNVYTVLSCLELHYFC